MKKNTVHAQIYSPWHNFIGGLDLELVNVGFGENITDWPLHKTFTGDNFFRIYLPLKGVFRLNYLEGSRIIEPGKLYLIPAQTPFTFLPVTASDHFWIHFISKQLRSVPALKSIIDLPVENQKKTHTVFRQLFKHVRSAKSVTDDIAVRNEISMILAPFLEIALKEIPQTAASKGQFSGVLEYIDRNLQHEINIANLNSMTTLSRSEFSALFRRTFGIPPKQYISRRRITQAKYLLWRTKNSVKEIAQQCGYENKYFFYRIFKKYTGTTPSQYRKEGIAD